MRKHSILLFLIFLPPVEAALAQVPQEPPSLNYRAERGLQRSDLQAFLDASKRLPEGATDVGFAISAAGRTNDPFWVPYLKPFLKYSRNRYRELAALADAAQLALARLGEKEELQEIGCEANFGSPSIQYNIVTHKLKYIQGWFSIEILSGWLDENHKFQALFVDRPSDMLFTRPQDVALKVLPEIVPNPPPFSSEPHVDYWMSRHDDEKLAPVRQAWREWINKNEESLRKLTPVGDGLDLSRPTCKRVLAHYQRFDRSNLK
jgi:hypothetical protein